MALPGSAPSENEPAVDREAADRILGRLFPSRRLRRVLLVNPPDADASLFRLETARRGRYTNYPPYGLMVLGANLRSVGVEVLLTNLNHQVLRRCHETREEDSFDFDATWQASLDAALAGFEPDLVVVTCMFTMTHRAFKEVCQRVAGARIPIAVGGVHVTNDLDHVLDDVGVVDLAVFGEGDRAIRSLVQVINRDRGPESLGQLVLVDRESSDGARYRFPTDQRPAGGELSMLPAWDLIDLDHYSRYGTVGSFYFLKSRDTRFATSLSNRGCRAQCTFCSVRNFNGKGVRQRSVESVLDELERLRDESGVRHVMWLDDDLFYDHKRTLALFEAMVTRNLGITWDASNGVIASSCTEELVDAAEASGCIGLHIGMESGNPGILRAIRKPANVDVLLRAAEVLRRHEAIFSIVFLMIGFPGETLGQIWDTIRVSREMNLDWYKVSQLQPLPNTPLFDSMVAQGLVRITETGEVRYSAGAFGKQNEVEGAKGLATANFREAFSSISLDAHPAGKQLDEVWFFMNYHLNFHRIFEEERPAKKRQLLAMLRNLTDVVAPEHGFALYFLGVLQSQLGGAPEPGLVERLQHRLDTSPYWKDRLAAFDLSVEDLVTQEFHGARNPLEIRA